MYNSIVVKVLVKIANALIEGYQYSILKKFNVFILKGLKNLSKGSNVANLFTSNRSLVEESLLYGLYCKVVARLNKIFIFLRKEIVKNSHGSIIYNTTYNLFYDEIQLQTTFYVFFISLGVGIVGNNLIRGFYAGKSYLVSFLLIFVSLIGLSMKENYKNILEGSYACTFIKSLFTIDEGVNQWW